ncbi:MAG: zf-TFIIB domain-containing protein, partial [Phycisphaerae bacterium]|nr:zf-TFIIB domain-containing protein [Phycisphaerae bacterium]
MQCPHDQQIMTEIVYEGVPIHSCDECGGEFVAAESMAHIVRTREERFPAELRDTLMHCRPSFTAPPRGAERELICPGCVTPMSVLNYAGDTGIMVDRCPSCGGLWL